MSGSATRKQTSAQESASPDKSMYILLSILLLINLGFLMFIVSRFPDDRAESLEEVKAQISDRRSGYEIEMHLSRYILLKMQIQKDIREGTDSQKVLEHIDLAIAELQAVLSIPETAEVLDASKQKDIRNELADMKRSRNSFSNE